MPNKKLDLTNGKTCPRCKEFKPMEGYSKGKGSTTGYQTYCKPCMSIRHDEYRRKNLEKIAGQQRERYAKNPERYRDYELKSNYGIEKGFYEKLFAQQNGRCAICKTESPRGRGNKLHVDHCHSSGTVRGLLCVDCNIALGKLKDSVELFQSAISYLSKSC